MFYSATLACDLKHLFVKTCMVTLEIPFLKAISATVFKTEHSIFYVLILVCYFLAWYLKNDENANVEFWIHL